MTEEKLKILFSVKLYKSSNFGLNLGDFQK